MEKENDNPIIIFDGECRLCREAIRFLKPGERESGLNFVPSADPSSESILRKYNVSIATTNKTVILIDNSRVFIKSSAIIKMLQKRGGPWKISGILFLIPSFLRDMVYDWIAKRRNRF